VQWHLGRTYISYLKRAITPIETRDSEWKAGSQQQQLTMSNMNYTKLISGLGMAAVMAGVTGCESMGRHPDERSEGRYKDDKNITESVKHALKEEPVYKFEGVSVDTFAGDVQLSGFVNSEDQKRRAQDIAARTPGVQRVINGLALKQFVPAPTPTGHSEIRVYSEPPAQIKSPKDEAPK